MNVSWSEIKKYTDIKFEFYNGVAKVTINRPKVYNAFRWRLLWMSPKLKTDKDMVDKCLEGRGYNVLK